MMETNFSNPYPRHGVPTLIPEIVSVCPDAYDEKSVRVVGRVDHYDAFKCIALLSEPNKPSSSSVKLRVNTRLTDQADYIVGSQVMLIGELEKVDLSACDLADDFTHGSGGIELRARVSRCIDGLDYAVYCKGVDIWRQFNSDMNMEHSS
ncbi:unnamed protein product [Lymnaea stagnalis]|uniref:CST complex subunit Ten1 n=1 Tax=Lymnaea stagnalis TaxID=6523 RepID=A0AAV2I9I6_LYMST